MSFSKTAVQKNCNPANSKENIFGGAKTGCKFTRTCILPQSLSAILNNHYPSEIS